MLSQYEGKWSFNTNRWHWPVTIRSWISGRSPKKFLSRWLRKMAKLERWRHPEAVTCFLRNWRYQCFPAVSFCKNLMQVMKFTMQSENFPCFSWRLLFSDCSGNIIGSRMSFDLSVFAQTCFDRIFGYEPEGPGTELLLKRENTGLINFPYSRGFIAVYASADSRWPILPQERIALWAENRWGDRMQVDKSWVITGKSHKPATMYTMLKGASTGFHHLEILSVGEVCIKNGHAVCQDVICRVRSCFRRLKAILKNCWQLRPELRIHCSEYHGYTPDFAWLLHSLTPEMTGQAVWWVVFLL